MEFQNPSHTAITDKIKLNEDFREAVLPVTIFVGAEAVLGLIGNAFVLYVFLVHYPHCTYRCFVLFLASIDVLSCLTTVPGEVLTQLNWYDYEYPMICKIKSFFNVFTVCADALCLLTIAVDRYRNQCRPQGWQFKPEHAKHVGFLNCLAAFIMALPCAILWGVEEVTYIFDEKRINVSICEKDERYADTNSPMAYSVSIECIIGLSLVTMIILYWMVAKKTVLRASSGETNTTDEAAGLLAENRHDSSNPTYRQNTLVMAILTVVFVITTITYFTLLSLIADNVLQKLSNTGKAVYFFFFRLYFINHVMNPVVYGILDPEFRSACAIVFRSACGRRPE